jgi:hypothetical protein
MTAATQSAVCSADGVQTVTYTGEFLIVDGVLPVFTVDGTAVTPTVDIPTYCTDQSVSTLTILSCSQVDLAVDPSYLGLATATLAFVNPAPIYCAGSTPIYNLPNPTLSSVEFPAICSGGGLQSLHYTGSFLIIDGVEPVFLLDGIDISSQVTIDIPNNCTVVTVDGLSGVVQDCSAVDIVFDPDVFTSGVLTVTDPAPSTCGWTGSVDHFPSPTLVAVTLPAVCEGGGLQTLQFSGDLTVFNGLDPIFDVDGTTVGSPVISGCVVQSPVAGFNISVCSSVTLSVNDAWLAGLPNSDWGTITVSDQSPISCTAATLIGKIPDPVIDDVQPGMTCEGTERQLTLSGSFYFLASFEPDFMVDSWVSPS